MRIGKLALGNLPPGEWKKLNLQERNLVLESVSGR
jgi:16S rRNA U516 pseudouridylate synthase RsuA-like enzyme